MTALTRRRRTEDPEDDYAPEPDDADERPRRRSRRGADEDERSARRSTRSRRSSRDEEDDKRSSRRSARSTRSTRSRRGDDDDRKSRRGRGTPAKGWDAYRDKRKSNSNFAGEFKPADRPDFEHVIHFVDEGPFDSYDRHWIPETDKGVKKSYICPEDDDCPLDEIGDKPSTMSVFNIVDMTAKRPTILAWQTSVSVTDMIQRLADSDRSSPLNREDLYFVVTVTKTKKKTSTDIQPLKDRDLREDFDIEPLTPEEIEEFEGEAFEDFTVVQQPDTREDLLDLIDEYGLDGN